MYQLRIKRSAEQDLRKLPHVLFVRINQKILALCEEPRPDSVKKLKGNVEGWRVRVGDYRIVYQIDDPEKLVMVIRVRHRRDVYR